MVEEAKGNGGMVGRGIVVVEGAVTTKVVVMVFE